MPETTKTAPALTVLYDGAVPLCRREISVYRGLQPLRTGAPICHADVSNAQVPQPSGTTRGQLLARFHVLRGDGALLSGAEDFLALWSALPGWLWRVLAGDHRPAVGCELGDGADIQAFSPWAARASALGLTA